MLTLDSNNNNMTTLDSSKLSMAHASIHSPRQIEVALVLEAALHNNFSQASVRIVDCPDLTQEPFHLAAKGLCGSPRLVEVGGVPYLVPTARKDKLYNLWDVPALCDVPDGMLVGAAAGPWPHVGKNSEMIPNLYISSSGRRNECHVVTVEDAGMKLAKLPEHEARSAILCNAFVSNGRPGKVFEITCENRTGSENFVSCLRKALDERYHDSVVGMGGVFMINSGKARVHVMPDFCSTPLESDGDVNKWLQFYEVSAPLICCTTFLSSDPGLDFRLEHTHCFSTHGEGGHYHCDTTPDRTGYHAYLNVAEHAYRIDRPDVARQTGCD